MLVPSRVGFATGVDTHCWNERACPGWVLKKALRFPNCGWNGFEDDDCAVERNDACPDGLTKHGWYAFGWS